MKKRVLVAMSGGVDSSVTAALLQKQGMDVEGITMKLTAGLCCDIASAQAVCHQLGIPHRMLNAEPQFAFNVVQDFIAEYRQGRTPNPCIKCNDLVKFQLLLDYARSHGFHSLATGHYARIEQDQVSAKFLLKKGVDAGKDQSYFLYRLTQQQMTHVLFPLGGLHKSDVRIMARRLALPAAERPESQEICFVPDNNYRSFLKENAPETLRPGDMVMIDGKTVGRHEGIAFFTVGQRRKLGVAAGERLYVVRVEPETNRVVLGKQVDLETSEIIVANTNMISDGRLAVPVRATVKIRYRSPYAPAMIESLSPAHVRVRFDHPVHGACPGQAAVFYQDDTVIGGGIIDS